MLQTMESPLAPAQLKDIPVITAWARDTGPRMNPTLQKVLEALARYASDDGHANPLQEQLLEHVDCSMSTLKRALADLKGLRLITITEERWAHDGRRNAYRLAGVYTGWVPKPRDLHQKPSVVDAAYKLIEERDAWISDLEEQLTGFGWSKGHELPSSVVEGQIAPTVPEEEELSGQNEIDDKSSSSSSPGPSGQADLGDPGLDVKLIPNGSEAAPEQPELSVVTFEAVDGPAVGEMEEWVTANWERTAWRSLGAALFRYRGDPAQFEIDKMAYEGQWLAEEAARALSEVPPAPAVPETPAEPETPLPEVVVEREAWDLWVQVLAVLHEKLPEETFSSWVRSTFGASIVAGAVEGAPRIIVVGCPTAFAVTWLERRMYEEVQELILAEAGELMEVRFMAAVSGALPWLDGEATSE